MVPFRQRLCCGRQTDLKGFLVLLAAILAGTTAALAQNLELQLDVSINGEPTGLIGAFTLLPNGAWLSYRRAEGTRHQA